MRSGHGSRSLAVLVWGALTLCAAVPHRAAAQPQVACVDPGNPELVSRIRGQTRDLPIRLAYVRAELQASPTAQQLHALAVQHHAQLVVQVSTLPGGAHAVLVYDEERSTLRRREVPAPSRRERLSRSAAAETIALIVRGELTDALRARTPEPDVSAPAEQSSTPSTNATPTRETSGTTPSTSPAQADRPATPEVTQPPARTAPPPTAARSEEPPPLSAAPDTGPSWLAPTGFSLGLGPRVTFASSEHVFASALLAVAVRFRHADLGVNASTSLKDDEHAETLTIRLREHTISGELMLRIPLAQRFTLSLGPGAGVLIHQRRTITTALTSWLPRDDRTHTSATVGARAALQLDISRHISAALRVGVDYMLRPLVFEFSSEANPGISYEISRLNKLAPWATLLLVAQL